MSKSIQYTFFKYVGSMTNSPLSLIAGLFMGLAISAFPGSASAADPSTDQSAQSGTSGRSAAFQKRIDAEKAAEDQRDRDHALQEQARKEELELKKMRAERAAQRNAAAAAAKQQEPQQQPQK